MPNAGIIFDIQRYAIHDGPGIRTIIFFKGCPLNCLWCHNPEGKTMEQEFMWTKERCLECRTCQNVCTKGAISFSEDSLLLDKGRCDICGVCVEGCHSHALEMVGKSMTVSQVMDEIAKDTLFYDESGGGVTFSGGEPLMQPDFLHSLLETCKEQGINTAVETCGYADSAILLRIGEHVDLFMYDLKVISDKKHVKFTGVSNRRILENLKMLSQTGQEIVVRFPLVPGVNDNEEDLLELGSFVSSLKNIRELNILPYHKAGVEKFNRLVKPKDSPFVSDPPSAEELSEIENKLKAFGLKIKIGG